MRATEFFDLSRFQSSYVQRLWCLHPGPLTESRPSPLLPLLFRSLLYFFSFFFFTSEEWHGKRIFFLFLFFYLFVIVRIYIFDVTGTSLFVRRIGHGSRMAEDRTQPIRHAARTNTTRVCAFVYSVARFLRWEEGGVGSVGIRWKRPWPILWMRDCSRGECKMKRRTVCVKKKKKGKEQERKEKKGNGRRSKLIIIRKILENSTRYGWKEGRSVIPIPGDDLTSVNGYND